MSCDIHAHAEVKINGRWHHWNHPRINRDYALFGTMAGVRYPERQKYPVRGLPRNATAITKFDYKHWGRDAHSVSWLKAKEVNELIKWYQDTYQKSFEYEELGYIFGNVWDFQTYPTKETMDGCRPAYEGMPEGLEDARLIFWFDC